MAAICLASISCSKESKNDNNGIDNSRIIGTYAGKVVMAVGENAMPGIDGTLTIKDVTKKNATIVTPTFDAMGGKMTMPALEIKNVKITQKNNLYTLEAPAFSIQVGETKYVNKNGLKGTVKDGKINVAYDITPGAMPMQINLTFEGAKQ